MKHPGEMDGEEIIRQNNAAVGLVLPPEKQVEDAILQILAKDAFDVLNWARRLGMKEQAQLDQVIAAFKKTFAEAGCFILPVKK